MEAMNWYQLPQDEIESILNSRMEEGLTKSEQERRLKLDGPNQLEEGKKQSAILMFLAQFKDFMVLVLLAATLLSGF